MSIKNFFAMLFIISISVFIFFKFYQVPIQTPIETTHSDKKTTIVQKSSRTPSISIETNFENSDNFILLTSLISSILSFLGFLISSYYSIKGHRREEELINMQKERERLEMDKIQAEIQALARGEI